MADLPHVTFPTVRTALFAGGLLAFGLSFDEVIVTTFTAGTQEHACDLDPRQPQAPEQRLIVNVVAVIVILLSFVPVYVAVRSDARPGCAVGAPDHASGRGAGRARPTIRPGRAVGAR